jgi:uncharacterized protein
VERGHGRSLGRERIEPLPEGLIEGLARPGAYPDDPSAPAGVTCVQTHLSHVFLSRAFVYKLRKAVDLGFVDFSTRAERNADCVREVALNRRLAPDVYRGVAPIEARGGEVRVGRVGEALVGSADTLEHCVVMRRLPDGADALSMLQRGALRAGHLEAVALRLAAFHRAHGLGVPAPYTQEAWLASIEAPVRANLELLEPAAGRELPPATWRRLAEGSREFLETHGTRFEARRREGRAVDGHGDVHLQHVWFEPGRPEPLLIDCIEFSESLRHIDAASEVAFLAMDLRYRARPALAERFLRSYAREADDYGLYGVLDYFVSYRAAVRAKVASIAAAESEIGPDQREAARRSARRHLGLAARALERRPAAGVVLVAGVVGTGKTTVAEGVADAIAAVVVSSDRVRRHLAGLAPGDRSGAGRGLYSDASKDAVYAAMLERAAALVDAGRVAVLDATYGSERHRRAVRDWAGERGVPLWTVEVRCERATALQRLARRAAEGTSASDAGPGLYDASAAGFEPLADPDVVWTDRLGWRGGLRARARAWGARLSAAAS